MSTPDLHKPLGAAEGTLRARSCLPRKGGDNPCTMHNMYKPAHKACLSLHTTSGLADVSLLCSDKAHACLAGNTAPHSYKYACNGSHREKASPLMGFLSWVAYRNRAPSCRINTVPASCSQSPSQRSLMFRCCPVLGKLLPADAQAARSKRTQEMKTVCHGSTLSKDLSTLLR